jgi:hypothetical protein
MILTKIGWATFWATISQTHLAALDLAFRGSAKMTILMIATIQPVSAFKKMVTSKNGLRARLHAQGCQIFLGTIYQNGENIPNVHIIYQVSTIYTKCPQYIPNVLNICIPNGTKLCQMGIKRSKLTIKMPTLSILRPKIYPN